MSAENAPVETTPNKAAAIAELDQAAAYTDMSNEQYETTRASIEAAHNLINVDAAESEATKVEVSLIEKASDRPVANAAALLAIHQAAAQGDWDDARIKLAEDQLAKKSGAK